MLKVTVEIGKSTAMLTFFGIPCFDCRTISQKEFTSKSIYRFTGSFEDDELNLLKFAKDDLEADPQIFNAEGHPIKLARKQSDHKIIYAFSADATHPYAIDEPRSVDHGHLVGRYSARNLIIIPRFRGLRLSKYLVLARATAIGGPPAEDRKLSTAGRAALESAYEWYCAQHPRDV